MRSSRTLIRQRIHERQSRAASRHHSRRLDLFEALEPRVMLSQVAFDAAMAFDTGSNPYSVTAADFNGDGKADLAVAIDNLNGTVIVLMNNGNGTFASGVDYATGSDSRSVTAADFNGDGKADLAVTNANSNTMNVLMNNGNGTFAAKVDYATDYGSFSVTAADFNGDGKADVAVGSDNLNGTVIVLLNNGNGTFASGVDYATGSESLSVTAADFNGDGKADLAVANRSSNTVGVLLNNGNGTFAARVDYATDSQPWSVTAADFNGDGKADLAVANRNSNTVSVMLNNGNGTFASRVDYATGSQPRSVTAADFNGDGKADLAVANTNSNTMSVLLNNGNGTFAARVNYGTGSQPWSVTAADFNGDGKADLAVANSGSGTVTVFLNNTVTPPANIDLTVQGTVTANSNPASSGSSLNVNYTIQNLGSTAASAGSTTRVQIKNSSGVTFYDHDFTLGSIAGSSTTGESHAVTLPLDIPAGMYAIELTLDRYDVVSQSDTSNDFGYGSLRVATSTPANLAPQNVALGKYTGLAGTSFTVNWTMANTGSGDAAATVTGLRWGKSSTAQTGVDLITSYPTPAIAAGTSLAQGTTVTVPAGTPAGTYYLWVIADNSIPSTLEQSSVADDDAVSAAFVVTAVAPTPLTPVAPGVSGVNIVSATPSGQSVGAGASFYITYTITSATSKQVLLGASIQPTGGGPAVNLAPYSSGFLSDDSVVILAAGVNHFSRQYTVPSGTAAGTYNLLNQLWTDVNGNGNIDVTTDTTLGSQLVTPNSVVLQAETIWGPIFNFESWNQSGYLGYDPIYHGTISWNQFVPLDLITGQRSVTGCVATAEAQVMYYLHLPTNFTITPSTFTSYTSSGSDGPIQIDTDSVTYDFPSFSSLASELSTIKYDGSAREKALLSFAVGIEAQMNYASSESGVYVNKYTFRNFGFKSTDDSSDWNAIKPTVISNIESGEPVVLAISDGNNGHAVVVEGYDSTSDKFYVDLGWGGRCDGWYSLPTVSAGGYNFTKIQTVLYNISPNIASPTGVSASQGTYRNGVQVTWNTSPDAVGYSVWRSTTNDPNAASQIAVSDANASSYNDPTAALNQSYYYWVKSLSQIGASDFGTAAAGNIAPVEHLVFATPPANVVAGVNMAPSVVVDVDDANGQIIAADHTAVRLQILTPGGIVMKTLTVSAKHGVATFTNVMMPLAGTYYLQATHGAFAPITSDDFVVSPAITTIPVPSVAYAGYTFGKPISLSTTCKSTTASSVPFTGTASLVRDDGTVLATATLTAAGLAKFTFAPVAGTYICTIQYVGDANHTAATSPTFTCKINPAATTTTLKSSTFAPVVGQDITLAATVAASSGGGTPRTGTITFMDGATFLGMVSLEGNSQTSLSITASGVGTHKYTATYSGDSNFKSSGPAGTNVAVKKDGVTALPVAGAGGTVYVGQSFTFTATFAVVAPGAGMPTGLVTFKDGGKVIGITSLDSGGNAQITTALLTAGNHKITAVYAGDTTHNGVTSVAIVQSIAKAGTVVALVPSASTAALGILVTFTATVTRTTPAIGIPTGKVQFKEGSKVLATVSLKNGTAIFTTSRLVLGGHDILGFYLGDANDLACYQDTLVQITG